MRSVRYVVALLSIAAAACGGTSPAAPTDLPPAGGGLPFIQGTYALTFLGDGLQCGDLKNPPAGTAVSVRATLRADSTVLTATYENNKVTLRFEPQSAPAGTGAAFGIAIAGTARGFADDEGVLADPRFSTTPNGTRIAFAENAALSGSMSAARVSDSSLGKVDAPVTYSRNGVASQCPPGVVVWMLNRTP